MAPAATPLPDRSPRATNGSHRSRAIQTPPANLFWGGGREGWPEPDRHVVRGYGEPESARAHPWVRPWAGPRANQERGDARRSANGADEGLRQDNPRRRCAQPPSSGAGLLGQMIGQATYANRNYADILARYLARAAEAFSSDRRSRILDLWLTLRGLTMMHQPVLRRSGWGAMVQRLPRSLRSTARCQLGGIILPNRRYRSRLGVTAKVGGRQRDRARSPRGRRNEEI